MASQLDFVGVELRLWILEAWRKVKRMYCGVSNSGIGIMTSGGVKSYTFKGAILGVWLLLIQLSAYLETRIG